MDLALRLLIACFVITAPTVLFLGLMRGLERLRDDALLTRLAESDDAPDDVSSAARRSLDKGPIRADGRGTTDASAIDPAPAPEFRVCSTCGESNVRSATYCKGCLAELRR